MSAAPQKKTLGHALEYTAAGISVVPVRADGSKAPALPEGNDVLNRRRHATEAELREWFGSGIFGLAMLCGPISGDRETVDLDRADLFGPFAELIEVETPGLLALLTVHRTPRGWHFCYRCPGHVLGNRKLAQEQDPKALPTDKPRPHALIETRGDGGYILLPGCPASCHETGLLYVYHGGPDLCHATVITTDQQQALFDCARFFHTWIEPERIPAVSLPAAIGGSRPGDDFNARAEWSDILLPADWKVDKQSAGKQGWTRPGKSKGISATTGLRDRCGKDLLHVFSSNAYPFEVDGNYDKIGAYARLNHNGDMSAAGKALYAAGWGNGGISLQEIQIPHTTATGQNGTAAAPNVTPRPPAEPWEKPIPLNAPPVVPPFPVDVFPAPHRSYAAEVAWAVNAPVDFVAVPMLVTAAGAIGNARWLTVTSSHKQPPVLFAAIIGRPGSGKSTPLDFVLAPLHVAEAEFYRKWEADKRAYDAATEKKDKEKPTLRRCLVDDTTVEALCRVLSENPRGVIMARDELAALVTGLNQYRDGGKGNDRQIFLKIWSAAPIKVDRSKLEGIPLTVRRPCLPIIGGIQPGVIDWLRGEQKDDRPPPDDGFFDRFLVSYPGDLPAIGEQWREVSPESLTDWHSTLTALLDLKQDVDESKDKRDLYPRGLPFTDEGRAAWARLTQEHADEVNDPNFPDWLRGPWQKLCPGYAGRLALVLQLLHWTCNEGSYDHVEGRSVVDAFRLVAYFKAHAKKVYAIMAADPCTREAAHILRWLIRNPGVKEFSRRDAHRQLAHTFSRSEALEAPLTRLVEHGYLRVLSSDQRPGPGRKASTRYSVNPLWDVDRIDSNRNLFLPKGLGTEESKDRIGQN